MTDKNTSMMREVFVLLSRHEEVPSDIDPKYWSGLAAGAAEIYRKYPTRLTARILIGVIDGLSDEYKDRYATRERKEAAQGEQLELDLSNPSF